MNIYQFIEYCYNRLAISKGVNTQSVNLGNVLQVVKVQKHGTFKDILPRKIYIVNTLSKGKTFSIQQPL